MKRNINYSAIFGYFSNDKPDKTGTVLTKIGKTAFTVSFFSTFFFFFTGDDDSGNALQSRIVLGLIGISLFVGMLMFVATGIHYAGREKGKTSFLSSTLLILKNTFLFLFLPTIIITAVIIIWAIVTKQPVFQ